MISGKTISKHIVPKMVRPYVVHPAEFISENFGANYYLNTRPFTADTFLCVSEGEDTHFMAPIHLPHNALVTAVTLNAHTGPDAGDQVLLTMARMELEANAYAALAYCAHVAVNGRSSVEDNTITNPRIDLNNYFYYFHLRITNTDTYTDARFHSAWIDWH